MVTQVPYHRGGKKLHINFMEATEMVKSGAAATMDAVSSTVTFPFRKRSRGSQSVRSLLRCTCAALGLAA